MPTIAGASRQIAGKFYDKGGHRFNIRHPDYGCDPTGAVDCATAMDACFTDAAAAGDPVLMPSGIYSRSTALTLGTSGTEFHSNRRAILRFTGATDGIILADALSLTRIVLSGLLIQTTNAGALKAIKADFHTSGGTEHILRDIALTVSGSGRWTHGFWGNNFQNSKLQNVRVVQSATIGYHFENFCNATSLDNVEGVGSSGAGTIERGIEVDGTSDLWCDNLTFQGYYTKSLVYVTGSGLHVKKFHFENTNGTPSDGYDVVIGNSAAACVNGEFSGGAGGSFIFGAGAGSIRQYTLDKSDVAAVVFGTTALGCGILFARAASITDNNTAIGNLVVGCSSAAGILYANKIPGQLIKANTTAIPAAVAAPTDSAMLANDGRLAALTSAGVGHDLLFMSSSDQTFLQFLTALNVRNTAGTQFAQMTSTQWRLIAGMMQTIESSNGAVWTYGQTSELLTLSTGGTTTDTAANLLPANAIIEAVVARVTTTITTATDWKLGDATTAGRFSAANAVMTAGTTQVGTVQADQTGAAGPRQTAAAKVRVTTTGTPGAGAIRITVFYRQLTAPAS